MTTVPTFKPTDACTKCKGRCCKNMGCHFAPSDFEEMSYEYLKKKIEETGYISIDWWENDEPQYYLRMRHKGAPIVDPSWGGECMLLTETGCSLSFEARPLGATSLEPKCDGKCVVHYSKYECKEDWLKYDDILKQLVEYFKK